MARHAYLIFDDNCGVCTRFAHIVHWLSKAKIALLGHHSEEGMRFKARYFRPEDRAEEMFWLVEGENFYGGRNGLLPVLREITRAGVSSNLGNDDLTVSTTSFLGMPKANSHYRGEARVSGSNCARRGGWLSRIIYTLSHGKTLRRQHRN